MQQSRNFYNARKCDKASQSAFLFERLFLDVKTRENKDWERLVPAAAVIPAVQVASIFIGSKTSVAWFSSLS